MTEPIDELRDEVKFLRRMVEDLVSQYRIPWIVVLLRARRHRPDGGRLSWRLSYIMALEEASTAETADAKRKPSIVLSELPLA